MSNMKIGLTGGIGSGKSKAAEIFETLKFYTIDADKISRTVMDKDTPTYKKIVEVFGENILSDDKTIDRKKLGLIVFNDHEKRKILENITHPAISAIEAKERGKIKAKNSKALIITHAALMVESGSYKNYDILITITTPENQRVQRIMKRDGVSEEIVLKIINSQAPNKEKLKVSHIIINNDKDETALIHEVTRAANLIKLLVYGITHR